MNGMIGNPASHQAGLYIHIPFCLSRCGYCTFVSSVYDASLADMYLTALESEMRFWNSFFADTVPATIFIGGGTPSCLEPRQLKRLLGLLPQPVQGEATCEVNPDSCTRDGLALLKEYRINRISFGVQTFDTEGLRLLQRRHNAAGAIRAIEMAMGMGFDSVSVDLIHGWPGQKEEVLKKDLDISIDLGIQHISNYTLIVDEDAVDYMLYRELLDGEEVDEGVGRRYWDIIDEILVGKGFIHYETSNFCREGFACRHNVSTWKGGEYLGVGLGACSHVRGERYGNTCDMELYIEKSGIYGGAVVYREKLEGERKAREGAVFWLRLFEGVVLKEFFARTGYDFMMLFDDVLPGLFEGGVMGTDGKRIWVERAYQPVLDSVLEYFI